MTGSGTTSRRQTAARVDARKLGDKLPCPARSAGFPPIIAHDARILILGTLPGQASLAAGRYYAHPRNQFWPIISRLFPTKPGHVLEPAAALTGNHLALWDVLHSAHRKGSLDAAIRQPEANDFTSLFDDYPNLEAIAFNGKGAARLFRRHVVPTLPFQKLNLPSVILPSTSPAFVQGFEHKLELWRAGLAPYTGLR